MNVSAFVMTPESVTNFAKRRIENILGDTIDQANYTQGMAVKFSCVASGLFKLAHVLEALGHLAAHLMHAFEKPDPEVETPAPAPTPEPTPEIIAQPNP